MNRATPGRDYGDRVAAEVEARYPEALYGVRRPVPKLKRHALDQAYCSYKVKGQRRYCYFGPFGSQTARARYAKFRHEWPRQLHDTPSQGKWPGPRFLTHDGRAMRLSAWAAEVGLRPGTIAYRLDKLGWSVEKALATPKVIPRPPRRLT